MPPCAADMLRVAGRCELTGGGRVEEILREPLHPAAFLIDGDEGAVARILPRERAELVAELAKLKRVFDIVRKKNEIT